MLNSIVGLLGNGAAAGGGTAYESISTVTVGTATSSISFTSIPSDYTHLQIRAMPLMSASDTQIDMQLNSDTATNYSRHTLYGNGSAAQVLSGSNTSVMIIGWNAASYTNAGAFVTDILDYANTSKYKTIRSLSGCDANGGGYAMLHSGSWRNTNAITAITIKTGSGNFNQYSSFALYGIKGA